jgi:hypothetical protein
MNKENRMEHDQLTWLEMIQEDEIKTMCMYCHRHLRGPVDGIVSHGCCDACLKKYHPEVTLQGRNEDENSNPSA